MARPLPRRRAERDAPDADQYSSRGRGRAEEDEPTEERRPRRGRGELPETGRRGRSSEPEPEGDDFPESKRALAKLSDDEWDDLIEALGTVAKDATEEEVWEAIEAARQVAEEPEPPSRGRGRGRSSRDEEPEDEPRGRGRGRGRSSSEDEDEPRGRGRGGRSSSRDDKEPEYDETRRPSRGFEGFKKTRKETGNFDDFKLTEDEVLVKFLEDEPFATYGEHGLYKELSKGQRVWTCLKPEECPVCNLGYKARAVALWNILVIPEEGEPKVVVLKAGPMLEELIEKKASLKTGPMSKEYYSLSQSESDKKDGPPVYAVEVIKERDLKEDWNEDPFTDDELDEYRDQMFGDDYVKYPTLKAMKDIARELRERD